MSMKPHIPAKRDLSPESIKRYTQRSALKLEAMQSDARDLLEDRQKDYRLRQSLCSPCFYIQGLAGQACTEFECAACNAVTMHGTTNTPVFCSECAKNHDICCRCGASLGSATS